MRMQAENSEVFASIQAPFAAKNRKSPLVRGVRSCNLRGYVTRLRVEGARNDSNPATVLNQRCTSCSRGVLHRGNTGRKFTLRAGANAPAATAHRATLDKYCISCHRGPTAFAGLHLDTLDTANFETNGATWEKLARKLRNREMPPAGMPRPDEGTYDALVRYIETGRDRLAKPSPIRDAARSIGSTERNMGTPFVICWRWRSMSRSCCRPTTSATASTTSQTCCRYRPS